ncbi:MAG TPA: SusC/RagA family TonB-linked outer membrane protein, partial [Chitinophagaceae bacterium]|nr:SusC/RagA family TonB-linked outer membrane protein [Chitinophagaceae bacterium]
MKKVYHVLILLYILPLCVSAQQKTISGKVSDANSAALHGASVSVNSGAGNNGVATDINGQYSISVPANTTELVFSFVGMKDIIEKINGRSVINITMNAGNDQLTNVVVIGYGSKRKETLTGSVSNITNKEIQTSVNVSLAQKLQGKVAGLQIRQLGGEPGNFDNSIVIRGYGGNPLYVIDGIIREGASEFQRLNPEDIESISFLKDASAAIYGFGAANGVVIVTTKKGKSGKASFTYNGAMGWMTPTDVPRMANAGEWMQMRNDAEIYSTGSPFIPKDELQKYINGEYPSTDWYDAAFNNTAMQQNHSLSASGGSEKTQYYMGLAFFDEGSFLKTKDLGYKRYNFRTNVTTELAKNLKAEVFFAGRYDKKYAPGENFFNIFKGTRVTLPTEQPYANGNTDFPAVVTPSNQNPLILTDKGITGYSETVNRNVQLTGALTWEIPFVKGLQLRGLAAYDMNNFQGKDVSKPYKLYTYTGGSYLVNPQRVGTAFVANNNGNSNRLTLQAQANYATTIAKVHNVAGTFVFEQRQDWNRSSYLRRFYDFYTTDQIDRASENNMFNSGGEYEEASQSVLGRLNYDFDKKYLLEFAFRYQGTSLFPPENRWGFFPVVSGGWRISEENFMNSLSWITNLKLRGSYGEIASSENISPFQWIPGFGLGGTSRYEFENGSLTTGATAPGIVNPNLTWINAKTSDIGLDIGLFNNKLTMEVDVYRRDQEGYPANRLQTITNTFGASLPQENLESYRTQGIEFTIGHSNRI